MISIIRFLHSTTAVLSEESPDINEILSTLLRTSKQVPPMIHTIGEKFVQRFSVLCSKSDLRVVQDCLKCLVNCLQKDSKRDEVEEHGECKLVGSFRCET